MKHIINQIRVTIIKFVYFVSRICEGQKIPQDVLREQIAKYREVFVRTIAQVILNP